MLNNYNMSFYEGVFDPQFQNTVLSRRHYIFQFSKLQKYKDRIADVMIYPPMKRYFKASHMISRENNVPELRLAYRLHKKEHPGCPILPNIKQELSKKIRDSPSVSPGSTLRQVQQKSLSSKTPDPRITFSHSFNVSKIVHHSKGLN